MVRTCRQKIGLQSEVHAVCIYGYAPHIWDDGPLKNHYQLRGENVRTKSRVEVWHRLETRMLHMPAIRKLLCEKNCMIKGTAWWKDLHHEKNCMMKRTEWWKDMHGEKNCMGKRTAWGNEKHLEKNCMVTRSSGWKELPGDAYSEWMMRRGTRREAIALDCTVRAVKQSGASSRMAIWRRKSG